MTTEPMKVMLKEEREKHKQALIGVYWAWLDTIKTDMARLNKSIRDELGTNETNGAFNRIKEDMEHIGFTLWRQAKADRRKAGL